MSTMIERVARAIAENPPAERYEERDGKTVLVRDLEMMARAAIEAMREPTVEMVQALRHSINVNGYQVRGAPLAIAAMIDAALNEKDTA